MLNARLSLVICSAVMLVALDGQDKPILGFSAQRSMIQRNLEAQYDSLLRKDNLHNWMKRMTERPQHVGSPQSRENAEFMVDLFRSWGYDAKTEVYHVLFPTPRERHLELLSPVSFKARLMEPEVEGDGSSGIRENRLPPYNAYSADGDVTGELVYVNQGIPADYDVLARYGVDVKGKIVIARYGGSWRGIKPKLAAQHGAIGCILYSDPRDDGFFQGDTYPNGPYRMEHGVQRGSVMDMPLYPGDPLTPGIGATEDAERLSRAEAPTLMTIPVLPISWSDAQPLLAALAGPVVPMNWRGSLPQTYHMGPGPARVRLRVVFDWQIVPAYNVVATLTGLEFPDEWIVRGNHRDAWVFGAQDPTSGMVALMEEARVVGELARLGHRPRRTIVYAGWDAEEQGLLGSTEWVEHRADELRQKAIIYINSDSNGRGFLGVGGSHTLERLINEVAESVIDPQTGVTVGKRQRSLRRLRGVAEANTREDLRISPLGSGSDYTPFLQHLGIASLNIGFGGESGGGSYHSAFDSFDYYVRFGDPGFDYGIALAKVAGRLTLRMANADIIPLRMQNFTDNVGTYVDQVVQLSATLRQEAVNHNHLIDSGAWTLAADPTKPFVLPARKTEVPHINYAPLRNAFEALQKSSLAYDEAVALRIESLSAEQQAAVNQVLLQLERAMTRAEGLPGRPWFRHQIYAPGYFTGYGVKTLPGVREALEQGDWDEADAQISIAAGVLMKVAAEIDRATALVQP